MVTSWMVYGLILFTATGVCSQEYDTQIQNEITEIKDQLFQLGSRVRALKQAPFSPGFIYFQLSPNPPPTELWPELSWIEVSSAYAGQFFRVEGGNSAVYGVVQREDAPRITHIFRNQGILEGGVDSIDLPLGSRSDKLWTGDDARQPATGRITVDFMTNNAEVRPRNQAIRIWKVQELKA